MADTHDMNAVPTSSVKYAGFWIRYVASVIDSIILIVPSFIVGIVVGIFFGVIGFTSNSDLVFVRIVGVAVNLIVTWIYFVLMTNVYGATLGKMLVGIQVRSVNFQKLPLGKILLRETVGKLVSAIILFIGYIMAGFTQKKQALHDKFAGSVVVYKDSLKPHGAGLVIGIILASILPIVAVIGILSSVVLVSLSDARRAGFDAQTKEVIGQMRTEAEVYYGNNNNSYSHAKDCSSGIFNDPTMIQIMQNMPESNAGSLSCYAEGSSYAISAQLSDSSSFCADNTGYFESGIAVDTASTASCQVNEPQIQSQTDYGQYGQVTATSSQ